MRLDWNSRRVRGGFGRSILWCCVWLAAPGLLPVDHASGQEATESLRALYEEAQQLPDTPEGRKAAVAKYQKIIAAHRANQAIYQDTLRKLVDAYTESDQVEEAIRLVVDTATQSKSESKDDVLRGIVQELQLKHADVFKKVLVEMDLMSERRHVVPQPTPRKDLADAILQRDDPQFRAEALEKLKGMLAEDAAENVQIQGLATLARALSAKFDRAEFLTRVRPLLQSEHPQVRRLAIAVLSGVGATEDDLDRVIALVDDENAAVRTRVGGALIQIGQGEHAERVIPALLKLLDDGESRVVDQTIRSMWGQYSSPEFNKRLIELCRNPRYHHNVIYFCLSTQRTKSQLVCERLIEELDDPDWNNSGRAAWGLTYGVIDQAKPTVEAGLLKALPEETNPYTQKQELRALRGVATERAREYVESVVKSELETDEVKGLAQEILADLDARVRTK